jgi:radical SAM superfamily enzyme YgiQ (UPF0313 family)
MRYIAPLFRPPSEAKSLILQATLGCSWNNCTYCHMYRSKSFKVRPVEDCLEELGEVADRAGGRVRKLFVADGDALVMPMENWEPILREAADSFPNLKQVSCYMGPESGDETVMRRLAKQPRPKGASREEDYLFEAHVEASKKAHEAGMKVSAIFLLGAGGVERSQAHAEGSARLITAMDPDYLAALTLTVVEGTPLAATMDRLGWELPDIYGLLGELRTMVGDSSPTQALFRTNHASNYLPLGGTLPKDRQRIVETIDLALAGAIPLRPKELRGL